MRLPAFLILPSFLPSCLPLITCATRITMMQARGLLLIFGQSHSGQLRAGAYRLLGTVGRSGLTLQPTKVRQLTCRRHKQTSKHTNRQTDRQTGRQADKQAGRQASWQTG
jgi:hypothetical protein